MVKYVVEKVTRDWELYPYDAQYLVFGMQKEMALKVFKDMYTHGGPFVVDVGEIEEPPPPNFDMRRLRLEVDVTPCREEYVARYILQQPVKPPETKLQTYVNSAADNIADWILGRILSQEVSDGT
jgi:hypothetical protein